MTVRVQEADFDTGAELAALRAGDARVTAPPSAGAKKLGGVAGWVDDRLGPAKGVNYLMKKVFPDHWSFMLGEIALYSFIILLLTGVFLTIWFKPSMAEIEYEGTYQLMRGLQVSEAFASTLAISGSLFAATVGGNETSGYLLCFAVTLLLAGLATVVGRRIA